MHKQPLALTAIALAIMSSTTASSAATASSDAAAPSVVQAPATSIPAAPAQAVAADVAPASMVQAPSVVVPSQKASQGLAASRISAEEPVAAEPRIIRGNDRVIASPKPVAALQGDAMAFKFEDAPIAEVVHLMLRDVVKADYILHQPVNGTVTLATQKDVSPDQAVLLLESALQANGLVMARDPRGTYHIGRPEALKGIVPAIRQVVPNAPLPPGSGAIIVPLQYIGAAEMAAILRPMLPPDGLVRVDSVRNLLVLAGNRTQAEGWLDVVSTFDVDLLKGMSVGVFPLKYASIKEVEAALRLMSGGGAAAAAVPSAAAGVSGGPGGGVAASSASTPAGLTEGFPLFGAVRVMPIERLNSVLVVTPRASYLEDARVWIERLDKPSSNSAEPQLYVYPVQNGSAKHLASVISGLFGGTGAVGSSNTGVAPGLQSNTLGTSGLGSSSGTGSSMFGSSTNTGATNLLGAAGSTFGSSNLNRTTQNTQGTAVQAVSLAPGVRMIADDINNAVLVYGTRSDFAKIESTLKRLDVPPTQVLIEASIIEVTLGDDLQYGLQWAFTNGTKNGGTGSGLLTTSSDGTISNLAKGFTYTMRNSAGSIQAVLNALASQSLLKVISSPSLMVLDNHTASISVGTQQPVQTATTVVTGGTVSNSIQYKDTGVSLTVTPSVNAGNMVTMELTQMVTDVGSTPDTVTGQRPFQQRQITSKVAVRSGEYLVLGGLIRDNSSSGNSGLPLLSSIPVVGGLFGTRNTSVARTELLVVLTPRVVRSDQEVRDVSEELRDRMKGFVGFEALKQAPKTGLLK